MDAAEQTRLLTEEVRRRRREFLAYRQQRPMAWRFRVVLALALPTVVMVAQQWLFGPEGGSFVGALVGGLIVSAVVGWQIRLTHKDTAGTDGGDVALEVLRRQKSWTRLTGRGWWARTVALGLALGLGVAMLVWMLGPMWLAWTHSLPMGDLLDGGLLFAALTFLWTVPGAFVIRWVSVWQERSFRRKAGISLGSP